MNVSLNNNTHDDISPKSVPFSPSSISSSPSPIQESPSVKSPKRYTSPSHAQLHEKMERAFKKAVHLYKGTFKDSKGPFSGAFPLEPNYICEVFDSRHRYGKKLDPFFTIWKKSTSCDDFTTWLNKLDKGQDVPGKEPLEKEKLLKSDGTPIDMEEGDYLDAKRQKECQLQVDQKGLIFTEQNKRQLLDSQQGKDKIRYAFVITAGRKHKIYTALRIIGINSHASLIEGRPVISSGCFYCEKGVITELINWSGHYKPTKEQAVVSVKEFISKGVDLSRAKILIRGKGEETTEIKGSDFIKQNKIIK